MSRLKGKFSTNRMELDRVPVPMELGKGMGAHITHQYGYKKRMKILNARSRRESVAKLELLAKERPLKPPVVEKVEE